MRLLKADCADVLAFEEFYDQNVPPYAILSHTWSSTPTDEVLYLDVIQGTSNNKQAYNKVRAALCQARQDKYKYCWVDTCCIDKSSSAELSEAINSMFRWYRASGICYAYLEDVSERHVTSTSSVETKTWTLQNSRWFSRGWTLQELLAPQNVQFYLKEWTDLPWNLDKRHKHYYLGSKFSLSSALSQPQVTGIQEDILNGQLDVSSASIAQRMSWASYRKTSRLEDEAYCLMGLFDVNMPMLYGEGSKAFIRLQEEIIKHSQDESMFAWRTSSNFRSSGFHGLLADSPKSFASSGKYVPYQIAELHDDNGKPFKSTDTNSTWTMTNRGLSLRLMLQGTGDKLVAVLGCQDPSIVGFIGIRIRQVKGNQYARIDCDRVERVYESGLPEQRFVPQTFMKESWPLMSCRVAIKIGQIQASSIRRWDPAPKVSDYVMQEALFHGDQLPSWVVAEPRWIEIPSSNRNKISLLFAALLIRSVQHNNQFVLLLKYSQRLDISKHLHFHVFETPFGAELAFDPTYKTKDWHEANKKQWMRLEGKHIRGVSLDAVPRNVPGGTCFEIDIAVHTYVNLEGYPAPSKEPVPYTDNEFSAEPNWKAKLAKLRTRT